jgi:hypothetical protein
MKIINAVCSQDKRKHIQVQCMYAKKKRKLFLVIASLQRFIIFCKNNREIYSTSHPSSHHTDPETDSDNL